MLLKSSIISRDAPLFIASDWKLFHCSWILAISCSSLGQSAFFQFARLLMIVVFQSLLLALLFHPSHSDHYFYYRSVAVLVCRFLGLLRRLRWWSSLSQIYFSYSFKTDLYPFESYQACDSFFGALILRR